MTEDKFWEIMEMLDWKYEGDDEMVVEPIVDYLSGSPDETIFGFDDMMSKLLYEIDGIEWARVLYTSPSKFDGDDFLKRRCIALVNGREYYQAVKTGKAKLHRELEFEAILYVCQDAWALKHEKNDEEYPYTARYNIETRSNRALWEG